MTGHSGLAKYSFAKLKKKNWSRHGLFGFSVCFFGVFLLLFFRFGEI